MSDAMDSSARGVIRRRIAIRERDGHERLLLNHEALRALLDAADERDRLTAVAPCSETHTEPFDFAYCSTHDRTFALGDHCDYAGLSEVGYLEKQAREQRVRAMRAEDDRDRLAAAAERVRALHAPEPFEMPNGEVWYRCGRCQHASDRPCPTLRALDDRHE